MSSFLSLLVRYKPRIMQSQNKARFLSSALGTTDNGCQISCPSNFLMDEIVPIHVSGISPHQLVHVKNSFSRNGVSYAASACFKADENGIVSLPNQAPIHGSYGGVKPMGLFTHMDIVSKKRTAFHTLINDFDHWLYTLSVFNGDTSIENSECLVSRNIKGVFTPPNVKKVFIKFKTLRATLFIPSGTGPFPSVIDIVGGVKGYVSYRAGMFASRGFLCLCVHYAGYDDLPPNLPTVWDMDYFVQAVEYIESIPELAKPGAIGVYGSCVGASVACNLALYAGDRVKSVSAAYPEVGAVISDFKIGDHVIPKAVSADFVMPDDAFIDVEGRRTLLMSTVYRKVLCEDANIKRHRFDFSAMSARLQLFFGSDDLFYNIPLAMQHMKKAIGTKKDVECMIYPGAGHVLHPGFLPMFGTVYSPVFNGEVMFGGQKDGHAFAQIDMWLRTIDFFRVTLGADQFAKL